MLAQVAEYVWRASTDGQLGAAKLEQRLRFLEGMRIGNLGKLFLTVGVEWVGFKLGKCGWKCENIEDRCRLIYVEEFVDGEKKQRHV